MKRKAILILCMLLALSLTLTGCARISAEEAGTESASESDTRTYETPAFDDPDTYPKLSALPLSPREGAVADLVIDGTRMQFITDAEKEAWRQPLVSLLSNVTVSIYEKGEWVRDEASVDPSAPVIADGHHCALYDVTMDGTPELLVYPWGGGGTSGNSTYYVYDILTGEEIGRISCAGGENFANYYCPDDGRLYSLCYYSLRCGDKAGYQILSYVATVSGTHRESGEEVVHYVTPDHLYAFYDNELAAFDKDGNVIGDWSMGDLADDEYYGLLPIEESYAIARYDVTAEEHQTEWEWMRSHFIRIPETEFLTAEWSDLPKDPTPTDYIERAEIMAEDLLSLDQKFLRYAEE